MSGEAPARSLREGCGWPGAGHAGASCLVCGKGHLHPPSWPTWLPGKSCTGNQALGNKQMPQTLFSTLCCWCFSRSVVSDSLRPHGLQPTRLLCPWDFPGKNTGVGCPFLFQGIFLTQGSNSYIGRWILYLWATREEVLSNQAQNRPLAIFLTKAGELPEGRRPDLTHVLGAVFSWQLLEWSLTRHHAEPGFHSFRYKSRHSRVHFRAEVVNASRLKGSSHLSLFSFLFSRAKVPKNLSWNHFFPHCRNSKCRQFWP